MSKLDGLTCNMYLLFIYSSGLGFSLFRILSHWSVNTMTGLFIHLMPPMVMYTFMWHSHVSWMVWHAICIYYLFILVDWGSHIFESFLTHTSKDIRVVWPDIFHLNYMENIHYFPQAGPFFTPGSVSTCKMYWAELRSQYIVRYVLTISILFGKLNRAWIVLLAMQ